MSKLASPRRAGKLGSPPPATPLALLCLLFSPGLALGLPLAQDWSWGFEDSNDVAVGDLNGDGQPDIFLANQGADQIYLNHSQNPGFVLDSAQSFPVTPTAGVQLVDLNADGRLDLWTLTPDDQIHLYLKNTQTGQFDPSFSYPVPNHVATEFVDFDADGKPDAWVLTAAEARLWRNDGTGQLTPDDTLALAVEAGAALAAADIDLDGDIDLWLADASGARVLLNDGGTFVESELFPFEGLNSITLADLDADGDIDAVLSSPERVQIFHNNGAGVFETVAQQWTGLWGRETAAADFDNDGLPDLVTFVPFLGARIWLNNEETPGHFNPYLYPIGSSDGRALKAADIDRDGDIDLVIATHNSPVEVWENDGTGLFGSNLHLEAGSALGVSVADLDGDGDLDAWTINQYGPDRLWYNTGTGTFANSGIAIGYESTHDIALGDLNGDGRVDAFAANAGANYAWLNRGGDFERLPVDKDAPNEEPEPLADPPVEEDPWPYPSSSVGASTGVALGDLDRDGDLDAFVSNYQGPNRVYMNTGGAFEVTPQLLGASDSVDVALGDLDGDGDLDAWVANDGQPDRIWLNQSGLGRFVESGIAIASAPSKAVALQDLNQDGLVDVVVALGSGLGVAVWINDGNLSNLTEITPSQILPAGEATGIGIGDLDFDGDPDLIIAHTGSPSTVWLNDGRGNFFSDDRPGIGGGETRDIAIADFDGDYDGDVWLVDATGKSEVWINQSQPVVGAALFENHGDTLACPGNTDLALGDLDGDLDLDIWLICEGADQVWINYNGDYVDSGQRLHSQLHQTNRVQLGDLDGDSDLDALVAANGAAEVWLNNGNAGFFKSGEMLGYDIVTDLALADFDSDRDLDAYLGNYMTINDIWLNNGRGVFAEDVQELGPGQTWLVAAADITGNRVPDIVDYFGLGYFRFWKNNGAGSFTLSSTREAPGVAAFAFGDLTGNSAQEMVSVGQGGTDRIWHNSGSGSFSPGSFAFDEYPSTDVALADFNSDGLVDIWIAKADGPGNALWLADGAGGFQRSDQPFPETPSLKVAVGDVNGDALPDVVVLKDNDLPAEIWINQPINLLIKAAEGFETDENGSIAAFEVTLGSPPFEPVYVEFLSTDTTEGVVQPMQMAFTPDNWNTPQTLSVTGQPDVEDDGDRPYMILVRPLESHDTRYHNVDPNDLSLMNRDNPDDDGDGIPDVFEIENGLNYLDPNDAALDPDADGWTNLEEFQAGTRIDLADTDGDGILDPQDADPLGATQCAAGAEQLLLAAQEITATLDCTISGTITNVGDITVKAGAIVNLQAPYIRFSPSFITEKGANVSISATP